MHPNPSYADSAYATGSIPAYNPAAYGPTHGPTLPHEDSYSRPPQPQYDIPSNAPAYPRNTDPRNPENVSVPHAAHTTRSGPGTSRGSWEASCAKTNAGAAGLDGGHDSDGSISLRTMTPGTPRARSPVSAPASPKSEGHARFVQFNDNPVESEHIITPLEGPETRRHRHHSRDRDRDDNRTRHRHSDQSPSRKKRRHSRETSNEREGDSDATEDLPPRFDAQGRKLPERGEDSLADKVEDLLSSSFFQHLADGFLNAGGDNRRR